MSAARHMIALLRSHLEGDDQEFLSVALQAAAHEARLGHAGNAQQLRELIDEAKRRSSAIQNRTGQLVVLEPRGELANLLQVQTPTLRLRDMALPEILEERLKRVLLEQRHQKVLREHSLSPRRKLLFVGPPGSGKTMTAAALAGELHQPLFTIAPAPAKLRCKTVHLPNSVVRRQRPDSKSTNLRRSDDHGTKKRSGGCIDHR